MIRIILVDDQALFREGLRTLLSIHPDVEVIAEAGNGQEAVHLAATLAPDIVLMDLNMPILDGVAATREIRANYPAIRILALTTFDDDEMVFEVLRAGASGYLLKDVPSEKLIEAIRAVSQGESFLQPSIAAKVIAEFTRLSAPAPAPLADPLSERELEILALVAQGSSNREIADALYITEGTVKNHLTNILGKLDVRDRTQAALKARDLGLLG